jgi:hypothetical protein
VSFEEQTQAGIEAGLFGRPLPERLGVLARTVDDSDTLAELDRLLLPQAAYEPVARHEHGDHRLLAVTFSYLVSDLAGEIDWHGIDGEAVKEAFADARLMRSLCGSCSTRSNDRDLTVHPATRKGSPRRRTAELPTAAGRSPTRNPAPRPNP